MYLTRSLLVMATMLPFACVPDDAAVFFSQCETYVAVVEDHCNRCFGLTDCRTFAEFQVAGGPECRGRRPESEELSDNYYAGCIQPSAALACPTPDEETSVVPPECALVYDGELATAQEEAGIGP